MKKTYQTHGDFESSTKQANPLTVLPSVSGLVCTYNKYYNISNNTEYGILGVMTDNKGNTDLTLRPEIKRSIKVLPNPILLDKANDTYADRDFSQLNKNDKIYFICWHDNSFNEKDFMEELKRYESIKSFIEYLDQYPFIPKRGNGGILTHA